MIARLLAPEGSLRSTDLLPCDQPLKPFPPLHPARYNVAVRAGLFVAVFVVVQVVVAVPFVGVIDRDFVADGVVLLSAVLAYVIVVRVVEQRAVVELAPRRALGLAGGVAFGVVAMGVTFGVLALVGAYQVTGLDTGYSPWAEIWVVGVVAGVSEELIFRGVLFRLLEDAFGTWIAVVVSAAAFGGAHLSNPDATWLGAIGIAVEAGVLFAGLYVVTRSLWWVIGLHAAWNVTQGPVFGSVISGTGEAGSFLVPSFTGPTWLTGGVFGVEASVVPIVLLGAVGAALLVVAHRHGRVVAPSWSRRRRLREEHRRACLSEAAGDAGPGAGRHPEGDSSATGQLVVHRPFHRVFGRPGARRAGSEGGDS